ncbi:hypothetical protein HN011_009109 [Eciton burchellii]|nr:hypothetical protein HN011_009109 [Eciton burchellii]
MPSIENHIKATKVLENLFGKKLGDRKISKQVKPYRDQLFSMKSHQEMETPAQYSPIRKQDWNWPRNEEEKAETFAPKQLSKSLPNPHEISLEEENMLLSNAIVTF